MWEVMAFPWQRESMYIGHPRMANCFLFRLAVRNDAVIHSIVPNYEIVGELSASDALPTKSMHVQRELSHQHLHPFPEW